MSDFKQGNFTVMLVGPIGSGKTVALRKIEAMLKEEGYEVKRSRESEAGFDHTLSVRWKV